MISTKHLFAGILTALLGPHTAFAAVYTCRDISGMAMYPEDAQPSWASDRITDGYFVVRFGGDNDGDVIVGIGGKQKSLTREGATAIRMAEMGQHGYDGLLILYSALGIVDQYSIFPDGAGFRLAWSTFRAPTVSMQPAKIGSYTARCERV